MKHVRIQLSDADGALIEERTVSGDFASIDDYVAALLDAQDDERRRERLEELLLEGVRSPSIPWTPEVRAEIRRAARSKA